MGDDNEITDLVRRESSSFLEAARRESQSKGRLYNVDEEFAKTKKNHSFLVLGVTLCTIIMLTVAAMLVTTIIRRRADAAPVDVKAFADLNLRDILGDTKHSESTLEQARLELSRVQDEIDAGIQAVQRDYEASVSSIRARAYPAAEESSRIAQASAKAEAQKSALQKRYAAELAAKKAAVDKAQKEYDALNSQISESDKAQQKALDNQDALYDLEKKKLSISYEGRIANLEAARKSDAQAMKAQRDQLQRSLIERFNPTFTDSTSRSLLGGWKEPQSYPEPKGFRPSLKTAAVIDDRTIAALNLSYTDYLFLSHSLRSVSYVNSVPQTLSRMEYETRTSTAAYREALDKSGQVIEKQTHVIATQADEIADLEKRLKVSEDSLAQYRWAVAQYALQNREGGYVVDPRDRDRMVVAINPALPVADGGRAFVIRSGDTPIATLRLSVGDGQISASVVKLVEGESIQPFDAIIVEVSAGNR